MIAGHSPQLIYSHKHHLEEPNLPKYMLFTRVDGLIVLTFEIPARNFIPPQPASTTTPSTVVQSVLSLQASSGHLFAGLTYSQYLPFPHPVSFPHPFPAGVISAADMQKCTNVVSNTSAAVTSNGDVDGQAVNPYGGDQV